LTVGQCEKAALLALSMVPGLGPTRIRTLLREVGSADAVFRASLDALTRVRGIGPKTAHEIKGMDPVAVARQQLIRARRVGATCLFPGQPGYPPLLEQIFDPPVILWSRGRSPDRPEKTIAVVGTRRPTSSGRRQAYEMAFELSRRGWTVVSGLAYGIDACAHRGALDAGGATVGVLGCGVDVVYPAAHRTLYSRVVRQGAVFSEFPLGEGPGSANFPRRNRVMSGICAGVILVEAFESGGGLITAAFALDQNREVFAVPGSPEMPASTGCNRLIQSGEAKLIMTVDDVEAEFGIVRRQGKDSQPTAAEATREVSNDPVLRCLSSSPVHVDTICERTGLNPAEVQARLLILEMHGTVTQLPGKRFYLNSLDS